MSNEEFEKMFEDTPFETMIIIRDWVNKYYVSKAEIKDKIKGLEELRKTLATHEELDFQIEILEELLNEEGEPDAK